MRLVPSHQVTDVLTGTVEDCAGLRGTDYTMLKVTLKIFRPEWHGHAVHKQIKMGEHRLIISVQAIPVRLYLNLVEALLTGKKRHAVSAG